jgi:predicted PurR-regulated permease PerM
MAGRALTIFLGLSLAIIGCWLLKLLKIVFLPLVIALLFTFLLGPAVEWLTRRRIPLVLAVLAVLTLSLALVFASGFMVLQSLASFTDEFPKYEEGIRVMVERAKALSRLEAGPINRDRITAELSRLSLSEVVGSTLNSFFNFLTYIMFTLVFLIYFLLGMPKLPAKIQKAFPPDQARIINEAVQSITLQVQRYILAKTFTGFVTGLLMMLTCVAFGVDFPITWGFFTFLLNFIPTLGAMVASIPPPLVALVKFGWVDALWMLMILTALMVVLGNLLEPRVLGESVNLSPLVTLFALIFWAWLWGPAGMIVAVPVTAMIKFTCDHVPDLRPIGVLMGGRT